MNGFAAETTGEAGTRALAAKLAKRLPGGAVVALHGPLGAGKTCFVRGLAEGLGLDPRDVSSPTFVLWHEYGVGGVLVHVDAYRIADPEELVALGFEERLEAADAVFAIEWAERVASLLPETRIDVHMAHAGAEVRHLTITGPGEVLTGLSRAEQ